MRIVLSSPLYPGSVSALVITSPTGIGKRDLREARRLRMLTNADTRACTSGSAPRIFGSKKKSNPSASAMNDRIFSASSLCSEIDAALPL